MTDPGKSERALLIITLALVAAGLAMIYSASAILADRQYGDSLYFLKRQGAWTLVGGLAMIVLSRVPYPFWQSAAAPLVLSAAGLLAVVLIPGIGAEVNGSRRWLRLGPFTAQPSELARLAVVIYLAHYLSAKREKLDDFVRGYLPPLIVTGAMLALIMAEPDLGTSAVTGMVAGLMLFIGGVRGWHLGATALTAVPLLYALIMTVGYRRERWMAFLDPWQDPSDSGFQIIQSFLALGSGGTFGTGLGDGRQKLFFLPYPHTDFVFAVIGEELGLAGALAVVLLFGLLAWRGLSVALRAPDLFGRYLAFGLTMLISVQALVNMGVVTGLLPTKGLTLPFLSYGGSSLVAQMAAIGMLWNISRAAPDQRYALFREKSRPRAAQGGVRAGRGR